MHLTLGGDVRRLMLLLMEIGIVILATDKGEKDAPNEVHIPLNTDDGATWLHLHFAPIGGDSVIMTLDDDSEFEEDDHAIRN